MNIQRAAEGETKCYRTLCPLDSEWAAMIRVEVETKDEVHGPLAMTERRWALLSSDFQVCHEHKGATELSHFFTDADKRAATEECERAGNPLPDWGTASIEWVRLPRRAERERMLREGR